MTPAFQFAYFAHSWVSDWNHGNAHFLRGLVRALARMGHKVRCYEQLGSWSLTNLVQSEGDRAIESIDQFRRTYAELDIQFYQPGEGLAGFLEQQLRGTDFVIVHEWNEPAVVNTILALKPKLGYRVLLHDTHHRAYSNAREILRFHLALFDGVLAFGEAITRIYRDGFGMAPVWTFHEAADTEAFFPLDLPKTCDVVWIGNWGDEERTRELREYLISPACALPQRKTVVYGVRYPDDAREQLERAGIEFRGYLPNLSAPRAYAESRLALHVPRRQYTNGLSGIPTIRMFEVMACGAPLVCSPWQDSEALFRPGVDYVRVESGDAMKGEIEFLLCDEPARAQIASNALQTIRQRHTCAHRARQLMDICEELGR